MEKNILLVDNDPKYLEVTSSLMEAHGFKVKKANTLEMASLALDSGFYNFLICDNRMKDNDDVSDQSGLEFLLSAKCQNMPRVLNTNWPATKSELEAIKGGVKDLLSKEDDIVPYAQNVFEELQANWDLQIIWEHEAGLSLNALASHLKDFRDTYSVQGIADELAYLFACHFQNRKVLKIKRLLWIRNYRIGFIVDLFSANAVSDSRIVICGWKETIQQEDLDYQNYIHNTSGIRTLTVDKTSTAHFLGIRSYRCTLGKELDEFQTLREFSMRATQEDLENIICNLDRATLSVNRGYQGPGASVREFYKSKMADIHMRQRLSAVITMLVDYAPRIGLKCDQEGMYFNLVLGSTGNENCIRLRHPNLMLREASFDFSVPTQPSLGQLFDNNILTDGDQVLLTEFLGSSNVAPGVRDYVSLESIIRYGWMSHGDLCQIYKIEQYLVGSFTRNPPKFPSPWDRQIQAIRTIRKAYEAMFDSSEAYRLAMFYLSIYYLVKLDPERPLTPNELRNGFRHLISAGLYTNYFLEDEAEKKVLQVGHMDNPPPLPKVQFHENSGQVTINDEHILLKGQALKLFIYLHEHPNQWRPRTAISKILWPDADREPARLNFNNLVRRLRSVLKEHGPQIIVVDSVRGCQLKIGN